MAEPKQNKQVISTEMGMTVDELNEALRQLQAEDSALRGSSVQVFVTLIDHVRMRTQIWEKVVANKPTWQVQPPAKL